MNNLDWTFYICFGSILQALMLKMKILVNESWNNENGILNRIWSLEHLSFGMHICIIKSDNYIRKYSDQ